MGESASELDPWGKTMARAGAAATERWAGQAASIIVERFIAGREQKAAQFLDDVQSQVETQSFARSMDHPETEAMFDAALHAAVETGVVAKRRLLSRVVSQALNDDAKVDESQLFVAALRELDGPHLRALARLNEADQRVDGNHRGEALKRVWEAEPVPVRAALIRTGCSTATVESIALNLMFVPTPTPVTEFGRQLLEWVLEADDEGQLG